MAIPCVVLWGISSFAQTRHSVAARASASLEELARQPKNRVVAGDVVQREIYEPERAVRHEKAAKASVAAGPPAMAATAPAAVVPNFTGFLGLGDNFTAIPPDTEGAVGPHDVVTMLNTQVMIQDRSGAPRSNFPITLNGFWSPLGNFNDTYDPRLLYDPSADRWIAAAAVDSNLATSALLLATSQTGDPGGTWNYFKVDVGSTNQWGDFPELGFNANWVVVSMNLFSIGKTNDYQTTNLYVFSKADLYQKNGTGTHSTFSEASGEFAPVRDYDNNHPGTLYLVQEFATDNTPTGSAAIRISSIAGAVGTENFRAGISTINIADPWSDTGPNNSGPTEVDFAPQPGTPVKIDTGDSRLGNCVLRNASIWCAHTVFLPYPQPTRTAAQWFQIDLSRATPALVQRGRIDDASGTYFYAYPSIAVNKNNDVLMGYTRFSATDYPSAGFSIRIASDPQNAMEPGVMMKAGEASYVSRGARSGANRWGDFSATMVDPVNDLDFWTIQEYAATPPSTRTGAFGAWWAHVTAPTGGITQQPVFTPQGVVSGASLQGGSVAPGELIAIFGINVGPAALQTALLTATGQFDTIAGGTRILFDGIAAPMLYAVSGQAGAIAPFRLRPGTTTQMQVEYLGTRSAPVTMAVAAAIPAIFTANESGTGQGSILNQDLTVNSASAPAARGSIIAIYATGGGAMATPVIDGSIEPTSPPFDALGQNVTVRIGGVPAEVRYQGAAPGIVQGVLQINAVVPISIAAGAVPVDLTIGGVTSRAGVTVAVR